VGRTMACMDTEANASDEWAVQHCGSHHSSTGCDECQGRSTAINARFCRGSSSSGHTQGSSELLDVPNAWSGRRVEEHLEEKVKPAPGSAAHQCPHQYPHCDGLGGHWASRRRRRAARACARGMRAVKQQDSSSSSETRTEGGGGPLRSAAFLVRRKV